MRTVSASMLSPEAGVVETQIRKIRDRFERDFQFRLPGCSIEQILWLRSAGLEFGR